MGCPSYPTYCRAEHKWQDAHLKVSVDDGCLALVQARNRITGVTEDLQHLSLSEAGLQPLIHQIDHLAPCKTISNYTAAKITWEINLTSICLN